jgi:hypothetical protein
METKPYRGWNRCAYLNCAGREVYVTLEVGPRILHYGFEGGPNELAVYDKHAGLAGGDEFRSYGGHRLWVAPEEDPKTFQPDNEPVAASEEDGRLVVSSAPDRFHIRREMRLMPDGESLRIEHRVYNEGAYAVELAPWALTVMAPGGVCLFPHAPHQPHEEKVLPARPLVLWGYTRMDDERWSWGGEVVRLRQGGPSPQKAGMLIEQGYAAYANHGNLFLKRFPYEEWAEYPDFGCNFETFTRHDMLEVESLGPLEVVQPGEYASHDEAWYLLEGMSPPEDAPDCFRWLERLAAERPLT